MRGGVQRYSLHSPRPYDRLCRADLFAYGYVTAYVSYNTKNGGSDVDRTLCVNNPSSGGTLQLYQCKSGDPNSLWYYKNGQLVSKKDEMCRPQGRSVSDMI